MFKHVIIHFVIFGVIYGSSAYAIKEKKYQSWILQLGLRETSTDAPTMNMNNTSKNEISILNNIEVPRENQESYTLSQIIKKSSLPLVELDGTFYYFGTYFKANFFKAMQFCRDHGMDLLSIETNEENTSILNYIMLKEPKIDHFWTSGSDLGEEGHFVWLATGKKYNFSFWSPPNPDNSGKIEHCMDIWKLGDKHYVWNDISCGNEYNFICEVEKCNDFCISTNRN